MWHSTAYSYNKFLMRHTIIGNVGAMLILMQYLTEISNKTRLKVYYVLPSCMVLCKTLITVLIVLYFVLFIVQIFRLLIFYISFTRCL